jgi:hypothetical protein
MPDEEVFEPGDLVVYPRFVNEHQVGVVVDPTGIGLSPNPVHGILCIRTETGSIVHIAKRVAINITR